MVRPTAATLFVDRNVGLDELVDFDAARADATDFDGASLTGTADPAAGRPRG